MEINNLVSKTDDNFFDTKFLELIESHLTYLRGLETNMVLPVSSLNSEKYRGDFFGLLADMNVPKDHWHITMRVNDYKSSADFDGKRDHIVIPSSQTLLLLKNIYRTIKKS